MSVAKVTLPCTCSLVSAVDADGNVVTTGCTASTKRTFAPGHDARLKGFLIRAGIQEMTVSVGAETNRTAEQVAEQFGFSYMVLAGITNGKAKLLAKLLGQVTKGAGTVTVKAAPQPVVIIAKVGRWVYEGTVTGEIFSYASAKGETKTTTKYTQVS